jgi:hypothetical protein
MTRILIVSKTRMTPYVCVGALAREPVLPLRLHSAQGGKLAPDCGYEVGQVWEIEFERMHTRTAPHVEDVRVLSVAHQRALTPAETRAAILRTITPTRGDARQLFGQALHLPAGRAHSAYIGKTRVPAFSTEFWEADRPLTYSPNTTAHPYYHYEGEGVDFKVKFVGFQSPLRVIPAGALLRMSLADWFDQDRQTEPRCYLQLSGWWLRG